MKRFGLSKSQKLCGDTAIDMLFSRSATDSSASLAYPLRGVWRTNPARRDNNADLRFLISVPKKRLRHAVDRVTMRRRIRESFRLSRLDYPALLDRSIDLGIVYVADKPLPYSIINRSLNKLLARMLPQPCEATTPAGQS